jgi:hypothetical protein
MIEMINAYAAPSAANGAAAVRPAASGFSMQDVAQFESAMSSAAGVPAGTAPAATKPASMLDSETLKAFFGPLGRINSAPDRLLAASEKLAANPDVGPGDMLMTMVNVQKFVFEAQITSSVANRTSDGVQELFRQQA